MTSIGGGGKGPAGRRIEENERLIAVSRLVLFLPHHLPESILAFFRARPAPVPVAVAEIRPAPSRVTPEPPIRQPRIPVRFAYVKVPHDTESAPNPGALLFSDKNRRARQEVPTPPDAKLFSRDPHSVGDSIERVKPDPNKPVGPESVESERQRAGGGRGGPATGTADQARDALAQGRAPDPADRPAGEGPAAPPPGSAGEQALVPRPGSGPGTEGGEGSAPDLKKTLRQMRSG